jgi:hypothetical protein
MKHDEMTDELDAKTFVVEDSNLKYATDVIK